MPKFDTFTDTFDTQIDPAKWTVPTGNQTTGLVVWDSATKSARLMMRSPSFVYGSLTSVGGTTYDLTASYVYAKLTLPSPLSLNAFVGMFVQLDGNNYLGMTVTSGNLVCSKDVASTITTVLTIPYNPVVHAWWRMRETGGTVFYEVSQDGRTWSTIASTATPSFATTAYLLIQTRLTVTNPGEYSTNLYVDYVNANPVDPWVLLTGPKGAPGSPVSVDRLVAGVQFPLTSPAVMRVCAAAGIANPATVAGFYFGSGWANYRSGFNPVRAYRSPQGLVTYQGLMLSAVGPGGTAFYLPWDMLPVGSVGGLRTALFDVGNGQSFWFFSLQGGIWSCTVRASQVSYSAQYSGVRTSYQTFVPNCWVDRGMKTDLIQGSASNTLIYTVGPGQISGYLRSTPFTQVFPAVSTGQITIPVTPPSTGNSYIFYYDVVNQQFAASMFAATSYSSFGVWDPPTWIQMAEAGQVMLAAFNVIYGTGLPDFTTTMDSRYLMYGPLDDLRAAAG